MESHAGPQPVETPMLADSPDETAASPRPPPPPAIVFSPLELRQIEDDGNEAHCWMPLPASTFSVRGAGYLKDGKKAPSSSASELLAVELFRRDEPLYAVASRPDSPAATLSSRSAAQLRSIFVVNLIIPSQTGVYQVVFYFGLHHSDTAAPADALLDRFVSGTDAFRNARFKLIPSVHEGGFIVKKAIGSRPAILGRTLKQRFSASGNVFEVAVDCNSSPTAGRVVSLVKSYAKSLVVDLAFVIEAQAADELPERLLGCCRLSHIELEAAMVPTFVAH